MYDLNELIDHKKELPKNIPIFLDSPLAIEATEVFERHTNYFDEDAKKYIFSGDDLFNFSGLKICYSREESKSINATKGTKIIIAGAGMMNGGRIQHHALRYLSDPKSTLFFTGFQAAKTLGRKILEGSSPITIFGQKIDVKCHVEYVDVLSAHADKNRLFEWIFNKGKTPKKIFLNHGDIEQIEPFANHLREKLKIEANIASVDEVYQI
jgi:metallo-beta-lactamase family protein